MAIGIVRALVGTTTATDSKGNTRVLRIGDAVELNETIQATNGATILIQFDNGGFATVGSNDRLVLDQSILDPAGDVGSSVRLASENEQSVADIQAMIEAGMDPTQIAEATAAGTDTDTAGDAEHSGSHSFVVVNQDGARAEVTPGLVENTSDISSNTTATLANVTEPPFLISNSDPVIDIDATIASGVVREPGVRGDDATLDGNSPNTAYDGQLIASGQIVATDRDGDTLSYTVKPSGTEGEGDVSAEGQYGSLTIDADGNYVYNLDGRANGLSQGDSVTETFTVTVSDGRGGVVEQELTITVNGTNDLPTLTVGWDTAGNNVTEDGIGTVNGTWSVADADADGSQQTISISGAKDTSGTGNDGHIGGENASEASYETEYGKLTLNPDGTYSYELKNDSEAVQKMGEGESRTESFDITTTDAHGSSHTQTIEVVITGTNDAPVITAQGSDLSLKEAGVTGNNQEVSGTESAGNSFTVKDVDTNDQLTATVKGEAITGQTTDAATGVITATTEYGTLTITPVNNADGSVSYQYNFALNANANSLNESQDVNYHFNIEVSDGKGGTTSQPVDVAIEGTNDAPTLTVGWDTAGNNVTEDGIGTVNGTWSVADADADGSQQTISISGAKDTSGTGNDGHIGGENASEASYETEYGKLTLNPDGTYSYELKNDSEAVQKMGEGESRTESFDITTTDAHGSSHTQTIEVVITGTNDAPTISIPDADKTLDAYQTGVAGADGVQDYIVSGQAHGDDVDHDAKLSYSFGMDADGNPILSVETSYGTMTIDSETGKYEFEVKGDAPGFADMESDSASLNFTIQVTDEHGAHNEEGVTVNVHRNSSPEIITTPDDMHDLTVKESGVIERGENVPNGGYAEGVNQTKVHGILSDSGSFTVKDADAQRGDALKATLTDKDGNPVEGVATDAATGVMTLVTEYGILSVTPVHNADGTVTFEYKFDLDNTKANHLAQDDSASMDFYIQVSDNSGASVTHGVNVTVEGTNDGPVVKGTQVHVKEAGLDNQGNATTDDGKDNGWINDKHHREEVSGQVNFSDPDKDAEVTLKADLSDGSKIVTETTVSVSGSHDANVTETVNVISNVTDGNIQTITTNYGVLTLNTISGEYSFKLDGATADHLAAGEKFVINFRVTAEDEHGSQGHHDSAIAVTVEGANDAPGLVSLDYTDYTGTTASSVSVDSKNPWEVEVAEQFFSS